MQLELESRFSVKDGRERGESNAMQAWIGTGGTSTNRVQVDDYEEPMYS